MDSFEGVERMEAPGSSEAGSGSAGASEAVERVHGIAVDRSRDALLTPFGKAMMVSDYLLPGESFQDRFACVARAFADDDAHAQRIYDYISRLWFMPATPVLSNGGTTRGLPISCYLSSCDDSLESIVGHWNENIWLASKGGGIGSYWGNLRGLGEKVGLNGKTSGIIPFIRVMDSLTLAISQGSLRRGSAAVYLPVSHPEIEEFIEVRRPTGGDPNRKALNLHNAVVVSDAFMEAVEKGLPWNLLSPKDGHVTKTVSARELWIRILTARIETGEPYILFSDTVNRAIPEHHRKSGLLVKQSNLCVAPETRILTRRGHLPIASLAGERVEVWNGEEWSEVEVVQTGRDQKLVTVRLDNGADLDVTPYHKFYVNESRGRQAVTREVRAHELRPGMEMVKFDLPLIEGTEEFPHAYASGFFTGDGTESGGKRILHLYGNKKRLVDVLREDAWLAGSDQEQANGRLSYVVKSPLAPKFTVPNAAHTVEARLRWLAGLLDADGCVLRNGESQTIQLGSTNAGLLRDVRLMLQTLGVESRISPMHEERVSHLPDGRGGLAEYNCLACERLLISGVEVQALLALGLRCNRLDIRPTRPNRSARRFVRVVAVEDRGRVDDTYCFSEPKRGMGVFEGVLTGQCAEITLPTGRDHLGQDRTAVCCLSSLNLDKWDEWEEHPTFIEDVMRFLDNVLQDYIDNAPDTMARAKYAAMRERSVGLGVMGFHSLLQSKGIPFESPVARVLNKKVFRHIRERADAASRRLAEERGACPDAADHGVMERFSNKLAVAPTASISVICGQSSPGIEPYAANCYTEKRKIGSFEVRNAHLARVLEAYGRNDDATWSSIVTSKGSVQHLDFLSAKEKAVFKTAFELDQKALIELAGDRAPFICQAQSLNIFLPGDVHKKELHEVHMLAWKRGVKSLYYCRSLSIQRAQNVSDATGNAWKGAASTFGGAVPAAPAQEGMPAEANKYEVCEACQ